MTRPASAWPWATTTTWPTSRTCRRAPTTRPPPAPRPHPVSYLEGRPRVPPDRPQPALVLRAPAGHEHNPGDPHRGTDGLADGLGRGPRQVVRTQARRVLRDPRPQLIAGAQRPLPTR